MLEYVAGLGYKQVEFAGYRQHANADGGPGANAVEGGVLNTVAFLAWGNTLRGWLDQYGLKANGTHAFIPSDIDTSTTAGQFNVDRFKLECEFAATLGMELYGTGGDVSRSRYAADWNVAAERWNTLGAIAKTFGLKLYTHNHDDAYNFLLDRKPLDEEGRPTRSSGVRLNEYGMTRLDPDLVFFELDIYWAHVAQHGFRTYTDADGVVQTSVFDPAALVARRRHRFVAFHAKDGVRTADPPGVGDAYTMVPFGDSGGDGPPPAVESGIDFSTFYDRIGSAQHVSFWEQDNAPGRREDQSGGTFETAGQSLAFAAKSFTAMVALGAVGS